MTSTIETDATGRDSLGQDASARLFPIRLGIGIVQGTGLWWLSQASDKINFLTWPANQPEVFAPLLLVFAFVPVLLLAGVGRMRPMTLAIWSSAATVTVALLALHDVTTRSVPDPDYPPYLSMPLILFTVVALFIVHHLVAPADRERRLIASFAAYFDTAWKAGVQLALSLGFTGAFWVLFFLGAALFNMIGLRFLSDLVEKSWFSIPLTTVVFAIAVHLTDVRDGLIRGVRTVGLMLLSWLLLVMTVLVAGFLAALPFTGLQGLWNTGNATALVLAASGALIVLINAAYQDGRPDNLPPLVLRHAVRVAALLLTPLTVIAFWGLALRIGQYGLTPDRIIAGACTVVGAIHAGGYAWAAVSTIKPGHNWMRPLERTNLIGAVGAVAAILALFSPVLDPARLSVADQVARLERGAVTPKKFDFHFLRFESGKAGEAALERLSRSKNEPIAKLAREMIAETNRWRDRTPEDATQDSPVIETWPAGATLPQGVMDAVRGNANSRPCWRKGECLATQGDWDGKGRDDVLVVSALEASLYSQNQANAWIHLGTWRTYACRGTVPDLRAALKAGTLTPRISPWPDLAVDDGAGMSFQPAAVDCVSKTAVTVPVSPPR